MGVVYTRLSLVLHTDWRVGGTKENSAQKTRGWNTKLSFEVCAAYHSTAIQWVISGTDREMKALQECEDSHHVRKSTPVTMIVTHTMM